MDEFLPKFSFTVSTSSNDNSTAEPQSQQVRQSQGEWKLRVRALGCPSVGKIIQFFISKYQYEGWTLEDKEKVVILIGYAERHKELYGFLHILEMFLCDRPETLIFCQPDLLPSNEYFGMKNQGIDLRYWKRKPSARRGPNPQRKRGYCDHGNYVEHHRRSVDSDWKKLWKVAKGDFSYFEIFRGRVIPQREVRIIHPGSENASCHIQE